MNPAENSAAIVVGKSESLTIYGATNGTGRLEATGGSWSAGIGGRTGNPTGGTVTINGGAIAAQGGAGASEMGAGEGSTQGKVWINGGIFAVRPKDEWLAVFRIVVENTDDATKVPNGYRVILNAVANAILPTAKVHVKKYGETYAEITGTQTNECGCLADAIAAAQAAPQGSVELVTNVNETVRKFQETYGFFPTNMIVRLLTDVKDCVECTVISEYYPEIAVTLDLNGFSLTGTGFIAVFGFIVWPLTFRKIVSVIPYYELKKDRAGAQGARLAHQDALRPVREAGRGRSIVTTTGRRSARFSRS